MNPKALYFAIYKSQMCNFLGGGGVGGGRGRRLFGLIFARYVPLRSQTPYPIIVHSVANDRPILVTFGQTCNLSDPNFTFHIQYKHSGKFANRKYGELSYPKNQKLCNPILVTLLKMIPLVPTPSPPPPLGEI